jgi:hypothetical protein
MIQFLTNEDVCKLLNIDIEGVTDIRIEMPVGDLPRAHITRLLFKPQIDWLSIINSGVSHRKVMQTIYELA